MDYAIVCSTTPQCKPILQQFIGENNIDESKVHWGLIPYRVDVSADDRVWVIPADFFNRWSHGREYEVIFEI